MIIVVVPLLTFFLFRQLNTNVHLIMEQKLWLSFYEGPSWKHLIAFFNNSIITRLLHIAPSVLLRFVLLLLFLLFSYSYQFDKRKRNASLSPSLLRTPNPIRDITILSLSGLSRSLFSSLSFFFFFFSSTCLVGVLLALEMKRKRGRKVFNFDISRPCLVVSFFPFQTCY